MKTKAIRGTPGYLSPELWKIYDAKSNSGYYNPFAYDIYALGFICLGLLLG